MLNLWILFCVIHFVAAGFLDLNDDNGRFGQEMDWLFEKNDISQQEEDSKPKTEYTVCRTKECFQVAAEFWKNMNKSVDPCEDFYEYACGGWSINNPIPPTEMAWSLFNVMQNEVNIRIRDFLEEPVHPQDILPIKQIKKFYQSCMDAEALEKLGIKPIENMLAMNGGWPMAMEPQEWDPEEFTWQQIDNFYFQLTHTSAFYSVNVKTVNDEYNANMKENTIPSFIMMKPPMLTPVVKLPRDQEFNRTKMYEDGSYANLITQVAMIFAGERGASIDKKQLEADVKDLIELEKKLDHKTAFFRDGFIFGPIDKLQTSFDKITHRTSISKINWKTTFANMFAEANVEPSENITLVMPQAKYLKVLSDVLDTTKFRTIVNFIHWNFISRLLEFTNTKMNTLLYELNKIQAGVKEQKPRWERCVENVDLKDAVSYQFVKKFFNDKMKDEAKRIFLSIQNQMIKHISKSDWLNEKTKKMELEKILAMKIKIGYPEWYDDSTALKNHYRGIVISHQFLANKIAYKKFNSIRNIRMLTNTVQKRGYWNMHPIIVNAYYSPIINALIVPAADFLSPFYSDGRPKTVNLGIFGSIVGHEVSHGFDDTGYMFDKNGNRARWPSAIQNQYKKNIKCFVDQYFNFYNMSSTNNEFLQTKSKETLGENIADSLGLQIMFEAFLEEKKEKNYPRLPGFEDISDEQSFFLSFAKLWCINSTPEFNELKRKDDSHSEERYRVIASIQNSDGFAKAFKCPKNSAMNPEKKCKIW